MEIEVTTRDVLLSNFNLWHYVLNKWYLTNLEIGTDKLFNSTWNEMEESWQKIFDIKWATECYGIAAEEQNIQATFWQVTYEQVKSV